MTDINRRNVALMAVLAQIFATSTSSAEQSPPSNAQTGTYLDRMPRAWRGNEKIAIVIYDHMTPLDVVGPHYYFGRVPGAEVQFVANSLRPIPCENGLFIMPTATFETCPADLDVLLVGGGTNGTLAAMRDPATLEFIADRGARAHWVASVCTGSLLLGEAGLLRGYRATSHWIGRPLLADYGAIEVDERVVFDRNRATGAGVSAGLDLALALVQRLRPLEFAQAVQLLSEYAPEPPLHGGTPQTAPPAVLQQVQQLTADFVNSARQMSVAYRDRH
ncbi:MAG: DJ-1/PfpI family protein [Hyphomonadaceae bacterium JAD_PAG50586_4]|nr:MAG: DJ-1/PfpI family protein [Hyphomonadaceae bacterium JAD_PAG50586_4]